MDGNRWFRFIEPAGTKLSNIDIGDSACSTAASGWMDGSDPTVIGEILNQRVCFSWNGACLWSSNVKASLCEDNDGQFYIYQLKKSEVCNLAYCAESG